MAEAFRIAKDATQPSISDVITDGKNQPVPLTGWSVVFRMRQRGVTAFTVDASAVVEDANAGIVRYDWNASDTRAAGWYKGWWHMTKSSAILDTPEFDVEVFAHQPGEDTLTGSIAEFVRGYIPETIRAMNDYPDSNFDTSALQRQIDLAKFSLFLTYCAPDKEGTFYNLPVLDYVAKRATVWLIPSAIDFWTNRFQTRTSTGTQEVEVFPNRVDNLMKLRDLLLQEIAGSSLEQNADGTWTLTQGSSSAGDGPSVSYGQPHAITPDPDFAVPPVRSYRHTLPWSQRPSLKWV